MSFIKPSFLFSSSFHLLIEYLCGIWAFGLGIRYFYELRRWDYVKVPANPVNIYFDFGLLMLFGFLLMFLVISQKIRILQIQAEAKRGDGE